MVFVKRPPPTEERGAVVRCTSSDILPLVDMMVAVIQVIRFSIAYSANEGAYKGMTLSRDSDMMIGAGMAGLFALSAGVGFSTTSECREARAAVYAPDPPRPRRRPPPATVVRTPPPAPEAREAEAAPADAGAPAPPDAGAPAPTLVVPEAPRAPAVRQRTDPE